MKTDIKSGQPSPTSLVLSQSADSKADIRLDLQGLRGVAILSVLGFHFFPKSFPNGFVGVDQFFVLSGFLMAMILTSGSGSPNICNFYYRRLKRIVPMHGLIILLILWSCILLFPDSNVDLNMESATAALPFLSNLPPLVDGKFTGYTRKLYVAEDLFAHTWSLAVEMQFYLIVPLLSILFKKRSMRISATYLLIIGGFSLAFHHLSSLNTSFYNPLARIWQFLAGSVAYLFSSKAGKRKVHDLIEEHQSPTQCAHKEKHRFPDSLYGQLRSAFNFLCIFLLLSGSFLPLRISSTGLRLTATIIAAVVLTMENKLLSLRCFVHFGDISYTLYLVHWPIYCWLKMNDHCSHYDLFVGVLYAWLIAVLLTRTYERWYRAANKSTIFIIITILYLLNTTTLLQSHNLRTFVNEHHLLLESNFTPEYPYNNITIGDAIKLNSKFNAEYVKNLYYERCEYKNDGDHKWWCTFKDMNESASASVLIIGNCWAANHARIIHESCKSRSKSMTFYGYSGCDVLVETPKFHCKHTFTDYVHFIEEMRPDYLFVIARSLALLKKSNNSNSEPSTEQIFTRTQRLQNIVRKRLFILDTLPRLISDFVCVLNSKLSKQKPFNQTELVSRVDVEYTRSAIHESVNSCEKCSLISYDDIFGSGSSFRVFDEKTKLSFFAGDNHISPFGLRRIAPIYEQICSLL